VIRAGGRDGNALSLLARLGLTHGDPAANLGGGAVRRRRDGDVGEHQRPVRLQPLGHRPEQCWLGAVRDRYEVRHRHHRRGVEPGSGRQVGDVAGQELDPAGVPGRGRLFPRRRQHRGRRGRPR
jgi:hypothetical protein